MKSLAEVCADLCLPRWRRMDAVMERLGDLDNYDPEPERLGRPVSLSEEQKADIARLVACGLGYRRISKLVGVSETVAKAAVKRIKEGR